MHYGAMQVSVIRTGSGFGVANGDEILETFDSLDDARVWAMTQCAEALGRGQMCDWIDLPDVN